MSIAFTKEDFQSFIEDIDNAITIDISEEEINNLTMAIAKTRDSEFSEKDIINALEHYKRDHLRCILWRAVLKGLLNVKISEDGNEVSFVAD